MTEKEEERYNLVMDMIRHKQYSIAIEGLERILEKEDRSPAALSLLGVALFRSGKDTKRGLELCKEAVRKESKNPSFYCNLADIYRRKKEKQKAIATLRAGLKVLPNSKQLIKILRRFGIRKAPLFPFLDRSNPINKLAGKIRS